MFCTLYVLRLTYVMEDKSTQPAITTARLRLVWGSLTLAQQLRGIVVQTLTVVYDQTAIVGHRFLLAVRWDASYHKWGPCSQWGPHCRDVIVPKRLCSHGAPKMLLGIRIRIMPHVPHAYV